MGGDRVVAWSLVLVLVAACTAAGEAAPAVPMTCGGVSSQLGPCPAYLRGQQASPPGPCCEGVRRLRGTLAATADRQFACNCIKRAASRYQDLKESAVTSLPDACGAPRIPFHISRTIDCSTVP